MRPLKSTEVNTSSSDSHFLVESVPLRYESVEFIMPSPTQVTRQPTTDVAYTLDELLACYDQHFVRRAYQTLLNREPDSEGLGYYLGRLRMGFSKLWILAQIRSSQESKASAPNLPWLDEAITRYRKGKYPLIGWIFRLGRDSEDDHPVESKLERKLRSIE